jgi:transcriptional regulator with XRE-family HTH domain
MLTKLRQLRKINDITLDQVAMDTGLSVGYLNRIERGYITDIKNNLKRKKLENYIKRLENKTKKEGILA